MAVLQVLLVVMLLVVVPVVLQTSRLVLVHPMVVQSI